MIGTLTHWTIWTVLAHPFRPGNPVDAWGGLLSCLGYLSIVAALIGHAAMTYRHHNCHVDGCKKLGHLDPAVHAPACKEHHSLGHLHGTPASKEPA